MLQRFRTAFAPSPKAVATEAFSQGIIESEGLDKGTVLVESIEGGSVDYWFQEVAVESDCSEAGSEESLGGGTSIPAELDLEPAVMVIADLHSCVVTEVESPGARRKIADAVSSAMSHAREKAVEAVPVVAAAGTRVLVGARETAVEIAPVIGEATVRVGRRALSAGMNASDAAGSLLGVSNSGDGLGLPRAACRVVVSASGMTVTVFTRLATVTVRAAVVITPIVAREIAKVVREEVSKS